jgi:hypothetical protein
MLFREDSVLLDYLNSRAPYFEPSTFTCSHVMPKAYSNLVTKHALFRVLNPSLIKAWLIGEDLSPLARAVTPSKGMLKTPLTCISHIQTAATVLLWRMLSGFLLLRVLLDMISTVPARPSVVKAAHYASLGCLATMGCKKCLTL